LKSYAHGLAALKLTAKDTGLTIDNVDDTMAELAEVMNNNRKLFVFSVYYNYSYYCYIRS